MVFQKDSTYVLATEKEVETALIQEAKKRGFKEGVRFRSAHANATYSILGYSLEFDGSLHCQRNAGCIFNTDNGKWAEIIETITKKDAERELGKKII